LATRKEKRNNKGGKVDHRIHYDVVNGIKINNPPDNRIIQKRIWRHNIKEPKTLEWISKFNKGEVLIDVGANIGQYTLEAANIGCTVHAFEPQALSFAELITNVYLNEFNNVYCYPFGISDKDGVFDLALSGFIPGESQNNIEGEGVAKHKIQTYSLDSLDISCDHIKIDIDGLEDLVVKGMQETLGKQRLKTILIEVEKYSTIEPILAAGFEIDKDYTFELSSKETNYVLRKK